MTMPLKKFLVDFSETLPSDAKLAGLGPSPVSAEDALAARIEDVRRLAREEARVDAESALAALRADHDAHLLEERRRWAADEGDRIATALSEGLRQLEGRLAEEVATLLEPIVVEAVRRKAAEELRTTLESVLSNSGNLSVVATGPDDLIAAIEAGYTGAARVDLQPSAASDIRIQAGDTQIRTQLAAWTERLHANLRAQP